MNAVLDFADMWSELADQLVSILQRRRSEVDALLSWVASLSRKVRRSTVAK